MRKKVVKGLANASLSSFNQRQVHVSELNGVFLIRREADFRSESHGSMCKSERGDP